jgi:hypothetical protein
VEKHGGTPSQVAEIISSSTEKQKLGSKVTSEPRCNIRMEEGSGKTERKCVFRNDPWGYGPLVKVKITDPRCLFAKNSHDERKQM